MPDANALTPWNVLSIQAAARPDKVALRDGESWITYGQLPDAVSTRCRALASVGIQPGDVVAMMLGNHCEHALAWLSTGSMGAIQCSLNPALRGSILTTVLVDSGAHTLLVEADIALELAQHAPTLATLKVLIVRPNQGVSEQEVAQAWHGTGLRVLGWKTFLTKTARVALGNVHRSDVFGLIYTSGSTGRPKGVQVTHAQTYMRCEPGSMGTPGSDDVTLSVCPMFHVVGLCRGVYSTLISGGTVVFVPRFSASQFWNQARNHEVTCAPLVGSMASFLMAQSQSEEDLQHGMRWVSMAPPIRNVDAFRNRFGVEVYTAYGLTEAVALTAGRASGKGNGWIRSDFDMRLVDELDDPVEPGEIGELIVRPHNAWTVMAGYRGDPTATISMMRNLWLHTGDLFRQDSRDGELCFVGRRGDRIRRRGENIPAVVIEEKVESCDGVASAHAIAVPDDEDIEDEIMVCVVPAHDDVDPSSLYKRLGALLPDFMVPRYILISADLPLTASQKVDRVALRQRVDQAWDSRSIQLTMSTNGGEGVAT